MGTTLTAALVEGEQVRLAHVGDSRAYLFRDGELHLLTEDHTLVHRMVEEGEITAEEAETHPHRSILTRALGVDEAVQVDEAIVQIRPSDRLLLCTDGLTGMVGDEAIRAVLAETADPQQAVERLVRSANRSGGVDNITAVILDVRDDGSSDGPGGDEGGARERPVATARPTERHPLATPTIPVDRDEAGPPSRPKARSGSRALRTVGLGAGVTLAVVVVGMVLLRLYLDTQWFVGISNDRVAIFRGVPAEVAGFELHSVVVETSVPAEEAEALALYRELPDGITADDREGAEMIVEQIRTDVERARATQP
jgi:protein phosphatase